MNSQLSKNKLRALVNFYQTKMNRTHYLKFPIDEDWSVRYFFVFDAKKRYDKKWVLKSHMTKEYIILTTAEALDYIKYKCKSTHPIEFFSVNENGGYRRSVINHGFPVSQFLFEPLEV